jgi:hypothetical protein
MDKYTPPMNFVGDHPRGHTRNYTRKSIPLLFPRGHCELYKENYTLVLFKDLYETELMSTEAGFLKRCVLVL